MESMFFCPACSVIYTKLVRFLGQVVTPNKRFWFDSSIVLVQPCRHFSPWQHWPSEPHHRVWVFPCLWLRDSGPYSSMLQRAGGAQKSKSRATRRHPYRNPWVHYRPCTTCYWHLSNIAALQPVCSFLASHSTKPSALRWPPPCCHWLI